MSAGVTSFCNECGGRIVGFASTGPALAYSACENTYGTGSHKSYWEAEVKRLTEERDHQTCWTSLRTALAAKDDALAQIVEVSERDRSCLGRLNDVRHLARTALGATQKEETNETASS